MRGGCSKSEGRFSVRCYLEDGFLPNGDRAVGVTAASDTDPKSTAGDTYRRTDPH
jgi:hypothetical protein